MPNNGIHLYESGHPVLNTATIMGNLMYTIAVILIVLWAVGVFGYNQGGIFHLLLAFAALALVLQVIRRT